MRKLLERITEGTNFLKSTIVLTSCSLLGAFFNYLVHPFLLRYLDVVTYGDFQALLSIFNFFAVFNMVVLWSVARETALLDESGEKLKIASLKYGLKKHMIKIMCLIYILVVVSSPWVTDFFKIKSTVSYLVVGLVLFLGPLNNLNKGILQGLSRFVEFGLASFVEPLLRFVFVILLVVVLPGGIMGASFSVVLNLACVYILGFYFLKEFRLKGRVVSSYPFTLFLKYSLFVFFVNLALIFFINLDVLFAKYFLNEESAGFYAGLTAVGRIVYFFGGIIPMIMFPKFVALSRHKSLKRYTVLAKFYSMFLVMLLPVLIVFYFFSPLIVSIFAGAKYIVVSQFLPYFVFSLFLLANINFFLQYFLAIGFKKIIYIVFFSLLFEVVLLSLNHGDLLSIITSVISSFVVLLTILIATIFYKWFRDLKSIAA